MAPTARLALKPVSNLRGLLDGAWWPCSRDLTRELSALADMLDPLWGRITRIAVNPLHWPPIPRTVAVNGHVVRVGRLTELDPHKILLSSYTAGRWDLLVIPPETSAPAAARLMAAASESTGRATTASSLMAAEQAFHGGSATDRRQDGGEKRPAGGSDHFTRSRQTA
ncbi:DUF5994 family protein [Streptomyces sp. NPDC017991]|uniref:DUF5994 family protein n=1 Tax=Streptomyces sp. NPDC017991 TaxID=3365026 RepID=UPI0037A051D6